MAVIDDRAKITKPSEETQDITDRKKENRKAVHVPKGHKESLITDVKLK